MSHGYHSEDELQTKNYDAQLMRRLFAYIRPYRGWFFLAGFLLLLATLASAFVPYLHMILIDEIIGNPERAALLAQGTSDPAYAAIFSRDASKLGNFVLFTFLLVMLETAFRYGQFLIIAIVGQRTMLDMRVQLFAHLQRMSLSFLDRNPVGRLMTRVTNDVENIQQTIVSGLIQVLSELCTVLFVIIIMFTLNVYLSLILVSTIPVMFIISFIFRRYARVSYLEIRRKIAVLNSYMQEMVSGMAIVQAFHFEDRSYKQFKAFNADHRNEWYKQIRNFAIYFPAVDFMGTLCIALIIYFGGRQILGEVPGATIGMLIAFVQWAERMYTPIRGIADKYNLIQAAMASSERIFELLDTPEQLRDVRDPHVPERIKGTVEFKNVTFAYLPNTPVLKNVSFSIAPGEKVAIVGHTGAGKSTLAGLLSRFYDVSEGSVTVDGIDVRNYEKSALRRQIGIVLQDVFLFSGSIDDNIRLGDASMTEEEVRRAATHVNAATFINGLPNQYRYNVGERGCNISTGQRQLIAFARTLAHDPSVLVLDEATSSVDTETEGLIQDAIAKLMEGRTSIVIAHRLSTIQNADRIILLHHGEIREIGTHQQLLAQKGLYHKLYQLQYKDQPVSQ